MYSRTWSSFTTASAIIRHSATRVQSTLKPNTSPASVASLNLDYAESVQAHIDSGVWFDAAVDRDGKYMHTSSWQDTAQKKYAIRRTRATTGVLKHVHALNGGFRAIEDAFGEFKNGHSERQMVASWL